MTIKTMLCVLLLSLMSYSVGSSFANSCGDAFGPECNWCRDGVGCMNCRPFYTRTFNSDKQLFDCERNDNPSAEEIEYATTGCSTNKCLGDDNPYCEDLRFWGCKTCADGFFRKNNDFVCTNCSIIPNCMHCNVDIYEWGGCDVCEDGYTLLWDVAFGYRRCLGPPIDEDTSTTSTESPITTTININDVSTTTTPTNTSNNSTEECPSTDLAFRMVFNGISNSQKEDLLCYQYGLYAKGGFNLTHSLNDSLECPTFVDFDFDDNSSLSAVSWSFDFCELDDLIFLDDYLASINYSILDVNTLEYVNVFDSESLYFVQQDGLENGLLFVQNLVEISDILEFVVNQGSIGDSKILVKYDLCFWNDLLSSVTSLTETNYCINDVFCQESVYVPNICNIGAQLEQVSPLFGINDVPEPGASYSLSDLSASPDLSDVFSTGIGTYTLKEDLKIVRSWYIKQCRKDSSEGTVEVDFDSNYLLVDALEFTVGETVFLPLYDTYLVPSECPALLQGYVVEVEYELEFDIVTVTVDTASFGPFDLFKSMQMNITELKLISIDELRSQTYKEVFEEYGLKTETECVVVDIANSSFTKYSGLTSYEQVQTIQSIQTFWNDDLGINFSNISSAEDITQGFYVECYEIRDSLLELVRKMAASNQTNLTTTPIELDNDTAKAELSDVVYDLNAAIVEYIERLLNEPDLTFDPDFFTSTTAPPDSTFSRRLLPQTMSDSSDAEFPSETAKKADSVDALNPSGSFSTALVTSVTDWLQENMRLLLGRRRLSGNSSGGGYFPPQPAPTPPPTLSFLDRAKNALRDVFDFGIDKLEEFVQEEGQKALDSFIERVKEKFFATETGGKVQDFIDNVFPLIPLKGEKTLKIKDKEVGKCEYDSNFDLPKPKFLFDIDFDFPDILFMNLTISVSASADATVICELSDSFSSQEFEIFKDDVSPAAMQLGVIPPGIPVTITPAAEIEAKAELELPLELKAEWKYGITGSLAVSAILETINGELKPRFENTPKLVPSRNEEYTYPGSDCELEASFKFYITTSIKVNLGIGLSKLSLDIIGLEASLSVPYVEMKLDWVGPEDDSQAQDKYGPESQQCYKDRCASDRRARFGAVAQIDIRGGFGAVIPQTKIAGLELIPEIPIVEYDPDEPLFKKDILVGEQCMILPVLSQYIGATAGCCPIDSLASSFGVSVCLQVLITVVSCYILFLSN